MNRFFSIILALCLLMAYSIGELMAEAASGNKTLIVYYSYTNHTEEIVTDLTSLISADVIEVEPAVKGLNYSANNYAIGTEQLSKIKANPTEESSYPAIDPVDVDMSQYGTVIIATPLWWSQMASNMQAFLFKYGKEMAGKQVGLIVSSHSSSISGVEADAKRLVPEGNFFNQSLWINNANHPNRKRLIEEWITSQMPKPMTIIINNHILTADLVNNSSTEALLTLLKDAPITFEAHDYGSFEKVGDIDLSLPRSDEEITTEPGDIILYQGNSICIFYGSNSWSYTRLGKLRNVNLSELREILGDGTVTVTLTLGQPSSVSTTLQNDVSKGTSLFNIIGQPLFQEPEHGIYIENGRKKMKRRT